MSTKKQDKKTTDIDICREIIIDLLNKINDETSLRLIYFFVKGQL